MRVARPTVVPADVVAARVDAECCAGEFGRAGGPALEGEGECAPLPPRIPDRQVSVAPRRVQLSRRRGWLKPVGAVVVARPSDWSNPFVVRAGRTRAAAVAQFEHALLQGDRASLTFTIDDVRRELARVDVACWCSLDEPCHGDVLLRLADSPPVAR